MTEAVVVLSSSDDKTTNDRALECALYALIKLGQGSLRQ